MKIDLNESLERRYFNESIEDKISIDNIVPQGFDWRHHTSSTNIVYTLDENLSEQIVSAFLQVIPEEEDDAPLQYKLKNIIYRLCTDSDSTSFYLDTINFYYEYAEDKWDVMDVSSDYYEKELQEILSLCNLSDDDFYKVLKSVDGF